MVSETFRFGSVQNAQKFIEHLKTNAIRGTFDFSSRPYTVTVADAETVTQQVRNIATSLEKEAVAYGKRISPTLDKWGNEAVDLTAVGAMHAERIIKPRYEQLKEFSDQFKKKLPIDITDESDEEKNRIQAHTDIIRNYRGTGNNANAVDFLPIENSYGIPRNEWFTIITNLKYPAYIVQTSKFLKGLGDYEPVAFLYLDEARNMVYGLVVQSPGNAENYHGYIVDVFNNSVNAIGTYAHSLKEMVTMVRNSLVTYINEQANGGITSPPKSETMDLAKKKRLNYP